MKKSVAYDHLGNEFSSVEKMCRAYHISTRTYYKQKKEGKKLEEILTKAYKTVTDHLGNTYPSQTAMCAAYGIPAWLYQSRIRYGFTQEQALTKKDKTVKDHLGNEYPSKKDMCIHYGIPKDTFGARLRMGWSLKDALEKPVKQNHINRPRAEVDMNKPGYKVEDHLGNRFNSISAMCRYYGAVNACTYLVRIQHGWNQERALTTPPRKCNGRNWKSDRVAINVEKIDVYDYLGNEYRSEAEMCEHYGVSVQIYHKKLDMGFSQEEIFHNHRRITGHYTDLQGRVFLTKKEMCDANGISDDLYNTRIRMGMSHEQALTMPPHQYTVQDHLGNQYSSIREMCAFYHINEGKYYYRRRLGWSLEKALTFKKRKKAKK